MHAFSAALVRERRYVGVVEVFDLGTVDLWNDVGQVLRTVDNAQSLDSGAITCRAVKRFASRANEIHHEGVAPSGACQGV